MTHNEAVRAGIIRSTSSRQSSVGRSPSRSRLDVLATRAMKVISAEKKNSKKIKDTSATSSSPDYLNPLDESSGEERRARSPLSNYTKTPASNRITNSPRTPEVFSSKGRSDDPPIQEAPEEEYPRGRNTNSSQPTPSMSGCTDSMADRDWSEGAKTPETSTVSHSPATSPSMTPIQEIVQQSSPPKTYFDMMIGTKKTPLRRSESIASDYGSPSRFPWNKSAAHFSLSEEQPVVKKREDSVGILKSISDYIPDILPLPPAMAPLRSTASTRRKSPEEFQDIEEENFKRRCF